MNSYTVRVANAKDKTRINEFIKCSFFVDMPLLAALGETDPSSIDDWPTLQDYSSGLSLVAETSDRVIVGVAVNILPSNSVDDSDFDVPIVKFFKTLDEDSSGLLSNIERTMWELHIIAVAKQWRRKGISKTLITASENLAKSNGHTNMFSICTGAYMKSAFERQNWEPRHTYLYKQFLEVDPNFQPPLSPHKSVIIFHKKLNSN